MQQRAAGRAKTRVNQVGYFCEAHEKILLVIDILLKNKPDNSVIFCNTSECVDFVKNYLKRCGFISSSSRAKRQVLVTTAGNDGVRRNFNCVINFDVPFALRIYTERLGMLDRNSHSSRCISLLCDYYSDFATPILAHHRLQCGWPPCDLRDYRLPERAEVRSWLAETPSPRAKPAASKAKNMRRAREPKKRSAKPVSYASRKADQIVADKLQRKSIWERLLSFLTR